MTTFEFKWRQAEIKRRVWAAIRSKDADSLRAALEELNRLDRCSQDELKPIIPR